MLKTIAQLYGCVCVCSLAHVLQTVASEKGTSDLLKTIYYGASHPAHSSREFNISPCLSAVDSGEEKMHRETSSQRYKHREWLIRETRWGQKQLY